ncbi:MAG: PIN domain-containing protein [Methanoregula sp.]|nr:PIN domain-containing protein [Methanoregula sp.]
MYLLDTNIFLEYILKRPRVREVTDFFSRADLSSLHVSDFSLHTIGVIFLRERKYPEFLTFINEDIIESGIRVLSIEPEDFSYVTRAAERFTLDFDDAYQYAVTEKFRLSLVSFDKDFDRTERGRHEPKDLFRD